MKQGGHPVGSGGFTIVETMIVLAVTGVLFVSAALLINGRQNRTAFTTAINGLQQQLQQIINETANGFYPQLTAFQCAQGTSGAPPKLNAQSLGDHQGQNPYCIFMGKVIQFGVKNTDPEQYGIFPILGNRLGTGVKPAEASTLYDPVTGSFPEAAAAGTTSNIGLTGINSTAYMQQGLHVVSMWYGNSTSNTTSTVGFISTLPSPDTVGVASGSQHLVLYTVTGTALNQTSADTADAIYPSATHTQPLQTTTLVSICVASGTTNQSGLITIGANDALNQSANLLVGLLIKDGLAC